MLCENSRIHSKCQLLLDIIIIIIIIIVIIIIIIIIIALKWIGSVNSLLERTRTELIEKMGSNRKG